MTPSAFYAWAEGRGRHELVEGRVQAMPRRRVGHARSRAACWRALAEAIDSSGSMAEALMGSAVEIGEATVHVPDLVVSAGPPLSGDAIAVPQPVVVVEIATEGRTDLLRKLVDYLSAPSIRHFLLLSVETRTLIHHRRAEDGTIHSAILREGPLTLDPPGLTVMVDALFPKA
ncbi:Uma2 family endonuclease [Falsiroseomonas sp.]|uniref:Uma2 family endonuclease n=1 Tax=Falsiroseomonas sp. TaxID=2870721 RepID=UPI003F71C477